MTARKPPPKPTVSIVQITPAMADKWMGTQARNRQLREHRIMYWLGVIERGEWRLTNDCIAFDEKGQLVNGQHRLAAIHLSGQTLPMGVMRNLPADTQDVMDSGLQRKTADALSMRQEKNSATLASALRWEHRLRYVEREERDSEAVHYKDHTHRPSSPVLLGIFDETPELWREMASIVPALSRTIGVRSGTSSAAFRRFWLLDDNDAAAFYEGLITGAKLDEDDPRLLFRTLVLNSRGRTSRRGADRIPDYREIALLCKAWNLWRAGETRQTLTWHYGGTHREEFPIPE